MANQNVQTGYFSWAFKKIFLLLIVIAGFSVFVLHANDLNFDSINQDQLASTRWKTASQFLTEKNKSAAISMLVLRTLMSLVIWSVICYLLIDAEGLRFTMITREGKKQIIHTKHFERFTMFTVWCWSLHGIYFALSAFTSCCTVFSIDIRVLLGVHLGRVIIIAAWVLFEISFSMSFFAIVTFVLIPGAKASEMSTLNYFKPASLLMHNANVVFCTIELMMNQLHFCIWHFPFVVILGILYVIFAWFWHARTGYYYYFFLDYDRQDAIACHLGLILAVFAFFMFGCGISYLNSATCCGGPLLIALTMLVMKIRDSDPRPADADAEGCAKQQGAAACC